MLTVVQMIGSLALLLAGGEALIRGAAALSLRLRISPLAVGLTVVAFGTSAPELVVSLDAALSGANDIAVGNVVGSNIANLLLILGVSALIRPVAIQAKLVRIDVPLMIAVSVVLVGMLADAQVTRFEGGALLAGLIAYTAFTFWEARREPAAVRDELATAAPSATIGLGACCGLVGSGLLALVAGGHLLVVAATKMALSLGVSQAMIGLTIVAVGTSLPECVMSILAAARGRGDIAAGNVVGSNIFNILGIAGVTAIIQPLNRGAISWVSLVVMLVATAACLLLLRSRRTLDRWEGGLLVAGYLGHLGWLIAN